jgi:hypothetical protein
MRMRSGAHITRTDPYRTKYDTARTEVLCEWMAESLTYGDEDCGDVESPIGHLARLGRHLVMTDERGFVESVSYADETLARCVYAAAEMVYGVWADEGDEYPDESTREHNLALAKRYLTYAVDCAENLVGAFDYHRWRMEGAPKSCIG